MSKPCSKNELLLQKGRKERKHKVECNWHLMVVTKKRESEEDVAICYGNFCALSLSLSLKTLVSPLTIRNFEKKNVLLRRLKWYSPSCLLRCCADSWVCEPDLVMKSQLKTPFLGCRWSSPQNDIHTRCCHHSLPKSSRFACFSVLEIESNHSWIVGHLDMLEQRHRLLLQQPKNGQRKPLCFL